MKNKYILIILSILIVSSISIFYLFSINNENNKDINILLDNIIDDNIITEIDGNMNSNDEEVVASDNVTDETYTNYDFSNDNKNDITSSNTNDDVIHSNNNTENTASENNDNNSDIIDDTGIKEEKEDNSIDDNQSITEDSEEDNTVDEEYERLKATCEFFDYDQCYMESIKVASSDTINIRNTSCEDVIYKGQIIGQRIIIFYRDGSWKYNNAT